MNNSDAYRATAEACAKLADAVKDEHATLVLLSMAEAWLRLADYVEQRERYDGNQHLGAGGSSDHDVNPK